MNFIDLYNYKHNLHSKLTDPCTEKDNRFAVKINQSVEKQNYEQIRISAARVFCV